MAFTARLPTELDRQLTEAAERLAVPKAVLIAKILHEWLQKERQKT